MKISKEYVLACEANLLTNETRNHECQEFSRIAYVLELQSAKYGNQWIITEFDAFSSHINDHLVPKSKIFQISVNNLDVQSSDGIRAVELNNGKIEFSPFDYYANNDLDQLLTFGNYGCMQVFSGNNVLWAFNRHNEIIHDIGIGNNVGNNYKDWTFMQNSNNYTIANLKIFAIKNVISFINTANHIDLIGVSHGDSLIYNSISKTFGQTRIPFLSNGDISKPNFIIALTGQSNSQGGNAYYDPNNSFDQPHERIFGFNTSRNIWEIADLQTESTGAFSHKLPGFQSLAFHFAKRLVEAYPDIRPGIINYGIGGQPIARWAIFHPNHEMYNLNRARCVTQGDIFETHADIITTALEQLHEQHKKINVICWHQGESDGDSNGIYPIQSPGANYYSQAINQLIHQYRSLKYCDLKTPFIVGETTGGDIGINNGWEARNVQLRNLNFDADPYTRCVYSSDLETSDGQYNNGDLIHFSANAQRIMGTRYFRAFRNIFNDF